MRLFITAILLLTISQKMLCQGGVTLQSGMFYNSFLNSDDEDNEYHYINKPTFTCGIQFFERKKRGAPVIGLNYKRISFEYDRSYSYKAPYRGSEEISSITNMIEFIFAQKIYFGNKNRYFIKLGLYGAWQFSSNETGVIDASWYEQTSDTSWAYVNELTLVNRESSYRYDYGPVIGFGLEMPYNKRIDVTITSDIRPLFGFTPIGAIDLRFGLNYKFHKNES